MSDPRPIGVFDSGLGGLTVLKALSEALPGESFLYVGDVARLPYGNKSPETIRRYGEQVLDFLVARGCKALVIACNTASTVFLDETQHRGLPLHNVVGPGARAAVAACPQGTIGVIATATTVQGHAYQKTIRALSPGREVLEVACPLFVPLAEEGMGDDEVTRILARRYLAPLSGVAALVLGCTHYPLLRPSIADVMGGGTRLVEAGPLLAEELRQSIPPAPAGAKRSLHVCTTDVTVAFERLAGRIMAPEIVPPIERVVL